jgi:enediyne biosynthesis protein E4
MAPLRAQACRAGIGVTVCLLAAVLLGPAGCSQDPVPTAAQTEDRAGAPWFEEVSAALGLNFVHDPGPTGTYFMPQSTGSGCAFFHDGDGSLYIYLLHLGGPQGKKNQLFKQQTDGTFQDVSRGSGLDIAGYCTGVTVGDVNNDGLPDVVVTQFGGIKLFLNLGGGHFEDVTEEAGLTNPSWGMSCALCDYNRDGWLDLVVVNYLDYDAKRDCLSAQGVKDFCGPTSFAARCSKLFRNGGPRPAAKDKPAARVAFEDVSFASGIGRMPGPGLGVVCADFNGDGWPDLFIANDTKPNRLWINQRDGTFKEEAASRGAAYTVTGTAYAGMGVAIGDVAGTGMFDLFVTHLNTETHTLWRQGPSGQFRDQTSPSGLMTSRWRGTGFGTLLADFDLDGALDLAVVNGRIMRGGKATGTALGFWETYAEKNQLFANEGSGTFHDVSEANAAFCGGWNVGRGLACADFNQDGAMDLLVTSSGGPARLFRNVAPKRGNWLTLRALDPKLKRDAYGAEVRVRAGTQTWLRLIHPAQSYLSSSTPQALFGLGKTQRIDAIDVTWPDGSPPERFDGGAVNRLLVLRKGEGRIP